MLLGVGHPNLPMISCWRTLDSPHGAGDDLPDQVQPHVPRPHHQETADGKSYHICCTCMQYSAVHHSVAVHRSVSQVMKLVCVGAEEKVVGLHMMGRGCDEMLQVLSDFVFLSKRVCRLPVKRSLSVSYREDYVVFLWRRVCCLPVERSLLSSY